MKIIPKRALMLFLIIRGPLTLFIPTVALSTYLLFFASDRYVSEVQFIVKSANKQVSSGAFGALLELSGIARADEDLHIVASYLSSHEAIEKLQARLPLAEIYSRPEADFALRFPSFVFQNNMRDFRRYLGFMIKTTFNQSTGIMLLEVQCFRAADCLDVANGLTEIAELRLNEMNERIRADTLRDAQAELELSKDKLVKAQLELTSLRNEQLSVDIGSSALVTMKLIAALEAEKLKIETQLKELAISAPTSPQIAPLQNRLTALVAQIVAERNKISDPKRGLAQAMGKYERLILEVEFAKTALAASEKSLESARENAQRQQLYIETISPPNLPDAPKYPSTVRSIATAFCLNLVFVLVGWLLYSGFIEHNASLE